VVPETEEMSEMAFDKIKQATERSISHNEIVTLDLADLGCTRQVALDLISEIVSADELESDYSVNGDVTEVWAWREGAPEGSMAWRVHFRA
jgi:hypothetical protein